MNVVAQRLEGGNVEHLSLIGQGAKSRPPDQIVDTKQKGRQSFARASWRRNKNIATLANGRPAEHLRFSRFPKAGLEPITHKRIEQGVHQSYFRWFGRG